MKEEHLKGNVLLEWKAPERVFVKRGKKYFKNLFAILLILAAVAIFFREFVLAALFGGIGFLQYVLGTVPPRGTKHKITTSGLRTLGHTYSWKELTRFWFGKSGGQTILHIETTHFYPRRITLLLGEEKEEKISSLLMRCIPLEEQPPEDPLEKFFTKLFRRIRLE